MNEFKRNIFWTEVNEDIIPPVDCKQANVTISSIDAEASDDGTVWVSYTNCAGDAADQQYADAGSYPGSLCVDPDTSFAFYYFVSGEATNAGNSGAIITVTNCGG